MAASRQVAPCRDRVHKVVVIGAGFGGLNVVHALAKAPVEVVLIDRSNHHLVQPLLYQVATAALAASDIASPIRAVFARQKNVEVMLGEVDGIDVAANRFRCAMSARSPTISLCWPPVRRRAGSGMTTGPSTRLG